MLARAVFTNQLRKNGTSKILHLGYVRTSPPAPPHAAVMECPGSAFHKALCLAHPRPAPRDAGILSALFLGDYFNSMCKSQ